MKPSDKIKSIASQNYLISDSGETSYLKCLVEAILDHLDEQHSKDGGK